MNTKRLRRVSVLASQPEQPSLTLQTVDSASTHETTQVGLEQLRSLQDELNQARRLLAIAEQRLAQQQQQLQVAHKKNRQQASLLNYLESRLREAQRLESLGLRVSEVVHDLNNILCPILSIAQIMRLKQPRLDDKSQKLLTLIEASAKRGESILKQLLFSEQDTDQNYSPVALMPLLQEVVDVVRVTFPNAICVRQQIPEQATWFVAADSTHLYQILMNLCVNAHDAMTDGGVLTIAAANDCADQISTQSSLKAPGKNYVVITITDTGTGISPDIQSRIFEPLFTTKEPGQGTGLGLATVGALVKHYGGFVQVFSDVGEGTSIKVFLPVVAAPSPYVL